MLAEIARASLTAAGHTRAPRANDTERSTATRMTDLNSTSLASDGGSFDSVTLIWESKSRLERFHPPELRQIGCQHRVEPAQNLVQMRLQFFEDGVILIGRLVVAHVHQILQRRELVVELNGIVERVARTAVAGLIQLLLNRVELCYC